MCRIQVYTALQPSGLPYPSGISYEIFRFSYLYYETSNVRLSWNAHFSTSCICCYAVFIYCWVWLLEYWLIGHGRRRKQWISSKRAHCESVARSTHTAWKRTRRRLFRWLFTFRNEFYFHFSCPFYEIPMTVRFLIWQYYLSWFFLPWSCFLAVSLYSRCKFSVKHTYLPHMYMRLSACSTTTFC